MYYRDKHFAIDNVLQITHDSDFLNWDAFILDWDS